MWSKKQIKGGVALGGLLITAPLLFLYTPFEVIGQLARSPFFNFMGPAAGAGASGFIATFGSIAAGCVGGCLVDVVAMCLPDRAEAVVVPLVVPLQPVVPAPVDDPIYYHYPRLFAPKAPIVVHVEEAKTLSL